MFNLTTPFRGGFLQRALLLCGLALCVATTAPTEARAQDGGDDEEAEPRLEAGRWALQFQVTPDFTLGSFQGATISAKKQLSSRSALRVGVTPAASYETESQEVNGEEGPVSPSTNSQALSVDAQWLGYTPLQNDVTAYYGAGPELGFNRVEDRRENDETDRAIYTTDTFLGAGVLGVIGAEWFVRSNISLTAEYRTALSYRRQVTSVVIEAVENQERSVTQNEVNFSARGVLFGVSVYF